MTQAYSEDRARIAAGSFTLRSLTAELAARGIKTDRRAVWTFLKADGLSFIKNRAVIGTVTSGYRP
jgi:putative transposase